MGITSYQIAPPPANENEREQAVIRSGALHATGRAELQEIVDRAAAAFDAPIAAVSIVFRDWQYVIAANGVMPGVYRRSTSFCGHAITTPHQVLCVPDATMDPRFAANPAVMDEMGLRFYAGAPLLDAQGLPLGAICVVDTEQRPALTTAQADYLTRMASEIMVVFRHHALVAAE